MVRIDFDGLARVVWIDDLAEGRPPAALSLCRRHADSLRPPRHWELRDLRPAAGAPSGVSDLSGGPELSESATAPVDPVGVDATGAMSLDSPVPPVAEEPAPAWSPRLFAAVDAGPVLDATSPLFSRAFRGF